MKIWRDGRRPRDEGAALIMVMGAMTVAMLVASVALNHGLQNAKHARQSTAWYQAFAAAQAGIDDYLARLNENDNYWQTVDCDNEALEGATTRTNSCGWNASTEPGWLDVPGSTNAEFHYDVDVTSTHVDGTVDLVATGRVDEAGEYSTRSLQVTLRRGGFGEFLYYTVYETKDPADYSNPTAMADCATYAWAVPSRRSACQTIAFSGDDVINGPMHTNDTMLLRDNSSRQGTHFKGTVTTSRPACRDANGPSQAYKCYTFDTYSSVHPRFDKGIAYREEVEIPESIGDLRKYVTPGLDPEPPLGCLYTGPTRIQFIPQPGTGPATMRVWSRWSKSLNPGCGNPNSSWPQVVNVPQNNLIMVQDVPAQQLEPSAGACRARSIDATGTWSANPTGTSATNGSLPQSGDFNQRSSNPDANCRYGTVYLDGTLKGRVTISADNNIVVVGNVTYQGGQNGTDALGLVSSNSVQIYHPVTTVCTREDRDDNCIAWGPGSNMSRPSSLGGTTFRNPVLQAAILTLQHSFEVQEYDVGSGLGDLTIYGTIAQRFRGAVGTSGGTGYDKDYNYDSRLRYAPPPYFLDPVRSSWGMKTFGEVAPRYRS